MSYRRLLEDLARLGIAVHAWAYVPGFDHQAQARQAWTELREARLRLIERTGSLPAPLRLGHSLGCKLQLLAPDGGRGSQSLMGPQLQQLRSGPINPIAG